MDRWISFAEKLPEDGTWNIFTDGKSISVERYKHDAIDHFLPKPRFFELEDAVAWMPFPEFPKDFKRWEDLWIDQELAK